MKKNCCWVNYKPVVVQKQTVKVVLHLSNYATRKELDHTTGVDTSNLAVKKDFITLKAKVRH